MVDNDTLIRMMGGTPKKQNPQNTQKTQNDDWESQVINGFKSGNQQPNQQSNNAPSNQQPNWESQLISGFKKQSSKGPTMKTSTPVDPMNPRLSGTDLENVSNKLKNIPPFLVFGILMLVVPAFFPAWGFLRMLGMVCIVIAIFDKVIPAENKRKAKIRIKSLIAKWKLKRLEKQLEKEEKNG